MRRSSFYKFLILVIIMSSTISLSAQQVDEKLPWSVRMTESEMIRCRNPGSLISAQTEMGLLPRTGIGGDA